MIVVLRSVACRKSALCLDEKMHCKEHNRVYCSFIVYTQGNDVASVVWLGTDWRRSLLSTDLGDVSQEFMLVPKCVFSQFT